MAAQPHRDAGEMLAVAPHQDALQAVDRPLVDTMALVLMVVVHAANVQDRDGAKWVLEKARHLYPELQLVWADGGYAGALIEWTKQVCQWVLQTVLRPVGVKGFVILPRRWVVERTFGWLTHYRRLSKDHEYLPVVSETMITVAMLHLMARRLYL
jgi:putative transposase